MHVRQICHKVIQDILNRESTPSLPTNLPALDDALWGLHKKELLVIGGRTSEGKTSLATQIAFNLSQASRVIFVSLEMTKEQLVERIICNHFSINSEAIRSGMCREDIVVKQQEIEDLFKNRQFIIVDDVGRTPESLEAEFEGLPVMPDVLVVDHLQQISVRNKSRLDALEEYVRYLKSFALKNNVAVVLVSQLNRGAHEGDRPQLYHLKACGAIEEIADTAILIYNHKDGTELLIEKQRHGPTGKLNVVFEKWFYRFSVERYSHSEHTVAQKFGGNLAYESDVEF